MRTRQASRRSFCPRRACHLKCGGATLQRVSTRVKAWKITRIEGPTVRSFDNEPVDGRKIRPYRHQQFMKRLLESFLSCAMFSLVSIANAQTTTTFRGHTLGESWQTFIRTEGGLCHLSEANDEACKQAAAGKKALLIQRSKENHASSQFNFEAGHFVRARGFMGVPKFVELKFLEETYGKPTFEASDPEKGMAIAHWYFSDGGKVEATETTHDSGRVTIEISVSEQATSKTPVARSNADDVCSFIVGKIRQALPDVPTICHVGETSNSLRYDVTVFSTVDVLQGKLRRAWSTALFDATQDLFYGTALGGTCHASSERIKCKVSFSDSEMARSWGRHYSVSSVPGMEKGLYGDPSSDEWYRNWWGMSGEKFEHSGSQGSAEWAGEKACELYLDALRHDPLSSLKPKDMPIPTCSVLVATDSIVYILVDFPASTTPKLLNYSDHLSETFGRVFSELPYKGIVTFKGSWRDYGDGPKRDMLSFQLRDLEFLFDEVHSGSRSAREADYLSVSDGQSDKYTLTEHASLGWVVNVAPKSDGRSLVKLTGGSQWSVPQTCQLNVGDNLVLSYPPDGKYGFLNITQHVQCNSEPEFVGSW
jgi:hypothetical protein